MFEPPPEDDPFKPLRTMMGISKEQWDADRNGESGVQRESQNDDQNKTGQSQVAVIDIDKVLGHIYQLEHELARSNMENMMLKGEIERLNQYIRENVKNES